MLLFVRKLLIWLVLLCLALIFIEIYQGRSIITREKLRPKNHRDFVESCIKGGATDALCDCTYRKFQYRFGDAHLNKLNTPNPQTMTEIELIKKRCERNIRLNSNQSQSPMLKYPHEN